MHPFDLGAHITQNLGDPLMGLLPIERGVFDVDVDRRPLGRLIMLSTLIHNDGRSHRAFLSVAPS